MLARICFALALAGAPSLVQAQNAQGQIVTPVDARGLPFGTSSNPFNVTGISGGGGSSGSVTAAGTNGTAAQAVQGINGGVPLAVSGTFWQATQPVSGTFWQATQPISAASLPLPSGAATAANQNVTAAGTTATSAQAVQGVTGGIPQNIALPTTATTTTGALQPATVASGKITRTSTALTASTSTTIAAANANRIAFGLQCGSGAVSIDETGGTLTAASVGNGTLFVPSGTAPYFTPPIATLTAITAYTATAQTCVVTEYLR